MEVIIHSIQTSKIVYKGSSSIFQKTSKCMKNLDELIYQETKGEKSKGKGYNKDKVINNY